MKKSEKKKTAQMKLLELQRKIDQEQTKLIDLRMQIKLGKIKDVHSFAKKRKEIAVLKTIKREKELKQNQKQ